MKQAITIFLAACLLTACGRDGTAEHKSLHTRKAGQDFPSKPIKLYVGFQPGGGTDLAARAVAALAKEHLGQPVVVVNMPGASGTLAAKKVATSRADGYTLLMAGGSETVSVGHYRELPYHPLHDFSPVIRLFVEKIVLSVNNDVPYQDLRAFVKNAKEHPGRYTYSSSGQFGIFHSAAIAFCRQAGIKMKHVPYKGGAPSVAALMGKHVDLTFTSPVSVTALHNSRQISCIALCSMSGRSTFLPDVPTMKEMEYDINIENQKGLVAPAGTPEERISVLHEAFGKVLQDPEFLDVAKKLQLEVAYLGPGDFRSSIKSVYDEIGVILSQL